MAIYTYATEPCRRDARRHGQESLLQSVSTYIEKRQNLVGFDYFLPTRFMKKHMGRNFRLLAYRVKVGDDEIILFLRIYVRGDKEYEDFIAYWDQKTDALVKKLFTLTDVDLQAIHNEVSKRFPPEPPPRPDEEEYRWLYDIPGRARDEKDDLLILETEGWVKKMGSDSMRDWLQTYRALLEGLDLRTLRPSHNGTVCHALWGEDGNVGIAYVYRPDIHRLLLAAPLRKGEPFTPGPLEADPYQNGQGDPVRDLSRHAIRSYPYVMVLDPEAWAKMQKDDEANLALSPEEALLLERTLHGRGDGTPSFPLFINGRAGSGKSTMLQYMAAEYLESALRWGGPLHPLYLACSRDLLENARKNLLRILTVHHQRLLDTPLDSEAIEGMLRRSLVVFHEFLYGLLPREDQERLSWERFVTYARFRKLWDAEFRMRPEASEIGVDLAWHTIRSFIKGCRSSIEEEFAPEDFLGLPKKRCSVTHGQFTHIYRTVWERWYRRLCTEKGYWDEQDLAALVLSRNALPKPGYGAIFCDEVQDFTPVELEVILQLSVFSNRSLTPEALARVPLVFAGDPLQTLNPTGFRWDATRAVFHDRFQAVLDPRRRANLEFQFEEFKFNYRSNPAIVRFCNLIQFLRSAVSGSEDIRPQTAWQIRKPVQPVWYGVDEALSRNLIMHRTGIVKIIPCEDGEESAYAEGDPILRALPRQGNGVFQNVLGSVRSKGLEFGEVAIYRFGDTAPDPLKAVIQGSRSPRDLKEDSLPLQYYLNRLYVAASRAKHCLLVVDSREAMDSFWRFATDQQVIRGLAASCNIPFEPWRESLSYLLRGQRDPCGGPQINQEEQAQEYRKRGIEKRDPYLLRQAALSFANCGRTGEEGRCLALAWQFEGNFKQAGDTYKEYGFYEEAFLAYWAGKAFGAIGLLVKEHPEMAGRMESRAADAMERKGPVDISFLESLFAAQRDPGWAGKAAGDTTWRYVFANILDRVVKEAARRRAVEAPPVQWFGVLQWAESVERTVPAREGDAREAFIRETGLESQRTPLLFPREQMGLTAFKAGEYPKTIRYFETCTPPQTGRPEYLRAKALTEPFPENLPWWRRLQEYRTILQEWGEKWRLLPDLGSVSMLVCDAVIEAAQNLEDLDTACDLLEARPERAHVETLLAKVMASGRRDMALRVSKVLVTAFVRGKSWEEALLAARENDLGQGAGEHGQGLKLLLDQTGGNDGILQTFVQELALSDDLPLESGARLSPISDFLYHRFISGGASRRTLPGLPFELVGAAIERAGRHITAIQFYDAHFYGDTVSAKERAYAGERLVCALEKLADHHRSRSERIQEESRRAEAERLRGVLGLGNRKLPVFPDLRGRFTLGKAVTVQTKGVFRATISHPHRRVRIEHTGRFETVTLDAAEKTLRGDATFSLVSHGLGLSWRMEDWAMTLDLEEGDGESVVVAQFEGGPLHVKL